MIRLPKFLRNTLTEEKIAALHDFLFESCLNEHFGPQYAKIVRKQRELLHPLGRRDIRKISTPKGLNLEVNLGDRLGCDLYYGVFTEQADFALFMSLLKPGSVMIDVGANIGVYALAAALKSGSSGKVIAFEPDSRSRQLLDKNVSQNHLQEHILLSHACVGEKDGTISFYQASEPSFSGIYDTGRSPVEDCVTVPIHKLDTLLPRMGCPKVDAIKIDVEGAEAEVLSGAMETIKNSDVFLMLEISKKNLDAERLQKLKTAFSLLEDAGFRAYKMPQNLKELIFIENITKIFDSNSNIGGNYFIVRKDSFQDKVMQKKFGKVRNLLLENAHSFVASRLINDGSPEYVESLLWAVKQRNAIAMKVINFAFNLNKELCFDRDTHPAS